MTKQQTWASPLPWKYPDNMIQISDYVGFVYEIKEKDTGMKYIGIKKFWKKKRNKKREKVQSDWRTYNSSCKQLALKMDKNPENYEKKILRLCKTVTEMRLYETKIQMDYYFDGRWNELFNEVIHIRVRIRKDKSV